MHGYYTIITEKGRDDNGILEGYSLSDMKDACEKLYLNSLTDVREASKRRPACLQDISRDK